MSKYYSNGKLLITGEYVVLDGATSLAVPTKYGQDLLVSKIKERVLLWESYDCNNNCWFQAEFRLSDLRIVNETFDANTEDSKETIAMTLQNVLLMAKNMNPDFLKTDGGFLVMTNLDFPREWGLGTSSTLINNIAQWAAVNAFELLRNSFGGSGYDIACAQNNTPITYQVKDEGVSVNQVSFQPEFLNQLYFVHLNVKQDSRAGIERYKKQRNNISESILAISELTKEIISCSNLHCFEKIMFEHERIISEIIQNKPIQELAFKDYFGHVKSLGAWGGDFVLATGNDDTPAYFKNKGFETVISYNEMVL